MHSSMEFIKTLGEGSFGSVELVKITGKSPYYVAVKTSYPQDHESLLKEFRILSKLKHCPRIIQTYGTSLSRSVNGNGITVYKMAMEYASGGSLASFIETSLLKLSDSMIRDFTYMILQGLVSIHNLGYVHCDIKLENILVFPRLCGDNRVVHELKISDFGMLTKVREESEFWEFDSPFLGTPLYMSPESVQDGIAEEALDIWALGCVVLEMYTEKPPWPFQESKELLPQLLNGNKPKIPEFLPRDARQFLETCFASNPKERGSALELLKHSFLKNVSDHEEIKITKKPIRVKIIPPKPPQFKKSSKRPLKLKIIPPKPPGSNLVFVQ